MRTTTYGTEFACNLFALNTAERQRHQEVFEEMQGHLQSVQEWPDGYAFEFLPQPTLLMLLAEFISRERRCCPFFTFEYLIRPDMFIACRSAEFNVEHFEQYLERFLIRPEPMQQYSSNHNVAIEAE